MTQRLTEARLRVLRALVKHGELECEGAYKGSEKWSNGWGKIVLRVHPNVRNELHEAGLVGIVPARLSAGRFLDNGSTMAVTDAGRSRALTDAEDRVDP